MWEHGAPKGNMKWLLFKQALVGLRIVAIGGSGEDLLLGISRQPLLPWQLLLCAPQQPSHLEPA
eukprot:363138-Chlamydomonas_euryale.AAC.2